MSRNLNISLSKMSDQVRSTYGLYRAYNADPIRMSYLTDTEKNFQIGNYTVNENYTKTLKSFVTDKNIVNRINQVFNAVKGIEITENDISGENLDIDMYNEFKEKRKFNPHDIADMEFFETQEEKQGLTLGVLIDISYSMSANMTYVRNLMASFYEGLNKVPNIKLIVYLYTSDDNHNLNISEIKNLQDCQKITIDESFIGMTPTFLAVDYITKKLVKISQVDGSKMALLVLTDGTPNGMGTGYKMAQTLTYRAIQKAINNNISCFGIGIEIKNYIHHNSKCYDTHRIRAGSYTDYYGRKRFTYTKKTNHELGKCYGTQINAFDDMKDIFKTHFVNCDTVQDAGKILTDKLTKFIEDINKK